ncbi:DNA methyltransferase, partial [Candidatus Pacearchaeota archaeon]|nr:DNA methyltransferase [Candidatus Pacearchaeota archaeon]
FKISIVLEDLGYKLKNDDRFQFYLTNTLEMKEPKQTRLLPDLAKEGAMAKEVKEKIPVLVILGNPPYSFKSTKTDFIEALMKDYKEMVRDEKKFGVLEDDYIKFIRFAQWKIDHSGCGIVGLITNHSYLFGVIHRGMRYKLMESFDEIYILNLHGNAKMQEKCPDGSKDENVFSIMQGVTIAIFVKTTETPSKTKIYYADLWGVREKKYQWLLENDFKTTQWQKLKPKEPYYFFIPKEFKGKIKYEKFWSVKDIFIEFGVGVITRRDKFAVDMAKNTLKNRLMMFKNLKLEDKFIEDGLGISDTYEWNLKSAREKVETENIDETIKIYNYRVWDCRWIYYSDAVISRTCRRVMKHLLSDNISLITTRFLSSFTFQHVFISKIVGDTCFISNKGKESNYYFPLYIYPESSPDDLFKATEVQIKPKPNFQPEFLREIRKVFPKILPEEIFHYIYGTLYSNIYRKKYEEFLKIDFPKIPLTNDKKLFKEMSVLGKELVEIHLLKSKSLQKTAAKYPITGSDRVEKVKHDDKNARVYINKEQYFGNMPKELWQYHIGAYQVLEKWLKDRKGHKLSSQEIEHYLKIVTAIKLTIEIQKKIDFIYREVEKNIISK